MRAVVTVLILYTTSFLWMCDLAVGRSISIRRARLTDRHIICGRHCAIHLETSVRNEKELHIQLEDLRTDFPALFSDEIFSAETTRYWVAECHFNIVGCIGVMDRVSDTSPEPFTYINSFSVESDFRKLGIGRQLLSTVLMDTFERGIHTVKLLTLKDVMEPAIQLYRSVGFQIEREDKSGYPYNLIDMILDETALKEYYEKHDKIT
mmetsp:Transcript_9840/g.9942  ORF Transcript_9840/g.9942 Transcript_9840/m.9942 type:complete len:207 (-) Transcript_9840:103-723(-)